MSLVKDVMTKNVISVTPKTTVDEAIELLLTHKISGAPVIDDNGQLVGIISEYGLLDVIFDSTFRDVCVGDVMTADPITVNENTLVWETASMFLVHRIRRLPVVRDGQLIGLVSRRDLLRSAFNQRSELRDIVDTAASFSNP